MGGAAGRGGLPGHGLEPRHRVVKVEVPEVAGRGPGARPGTSGGPVNLPGSHTWRKGEAAGRDAREGVGRGGEG